MVLLEDLKSLPNALPQYETRGDGNASCSRHEPYELALRAYLRTALGETHESTRSISMEGGSRMQLIISPQKTGETI
jgi:hypothetical protein